MNPLVPEEAQAVGTSAMVGAAHNMSRAGWNFGAAGNLFWAALGIATSLMFGYK